MKLFFSGIASPVEVDMLKTAGVGLDHMLADPTDWRHLPTDRLELGNEIDIDDMPPDPCPALDSGAYRAHKAGSPIEDVEQWAREVTGTLETMWGFPGHGLAFVTMPDVFGDPQTTWERWCHLRTRIDGPPYNREWCEHRTALHRHLVPVWQWGGPPEHLESMAAWARDNDQLVAIGGCVPWMRDRDRGNLEQLVAMARSHGTHMHVLGLNWLEAMTTLAPLVRSCDTSKWLDGARYGVVIHERDGRLGVERKHHCRRGEDRVSLCVESAETLHRVINHVGTTPCRSPGGPARRVRHYTLKTGDDAPRYRGPGKVNMLATLHSAAEIEKRGEEQKEIRQMEFEYRRRK